MKIPYAEGLEQQMGRSGVSLRVDALQSEPARRDLVPTRLSDLVLLVAARLAEAGEELAAGDHILSGAFTTRALPLDVGQTVEATLGDFGVVRCSGAA